METSENLKVFLTFSGGRERVRQKFIVLSQQVTEITPLSPKTPPLFVCKYSQNTWMLNIPGNLLQKRCIHLILFQ